MRKTLKERFEEKYIPVTESGCWIWTAGVDQSGYGQIRHNRKLKKAHRVSLVLSNKKIPDGMCVLHKCDVPSCVNPDHLFIGSKADNNVDMVNKGRAKYLKGEESGSAKITEKTAKIIKNSTKQGIILAKIYDLHTSTISAIRTGRIWKHI